MNEDAPGSPPSDLRSADVRRKLYASILLFCLLAIAGIALVTLWAPDLLGSAVVKAVATLGIVAGLSTVFYLYASESFGKKSRLLVFLSCGAAALLALVTIAEIWGEVFDEATFFKVAVSLIVIGGMASVVMAVTDDFFESSRLKDQNYLE